MSAPLFHMIEGAPAPVAPYSHAVEADGWVFVTGQMPNDPDDDDGPLPQRIEGQTHKVMENLQVVLVGSVWAWSTWSRCECSSLASKTTTLP